MQVQSVANATLMEKVGRKREVVVAEQANEGEAGCAVVATTHCEIIDHVQRYKRYCNNLSSRNVFKFE